MFKKFNLEKETKDIIAKRAKSIENVPDNNIYELYKENDSDSDSDSEKDNDNTKNKVSLK